MSKDRDEAGSAGTLRSATLPSAADLGSRRNLAQPNPAGQVSMLFAAGSRFTKRSAARSERRRLLDRLRHGASRQPLSPPDDSLRHGDVELPPVLRRARREPSAERAG